jgi:hypothetical protein
LRLLLAKKTTGSQALTQKAWNFVFSNTLCVITGLLYINDVDDDDQLKQHL